MRQKLTTGFQIMVKWFRENWVRVNVKKTHTMFLGRKKRLPQLQHISVEHEGQTLASKKSVKYLFFDDKLCWEEHINSVVKTASRSLGMLWRVYKYLPLKTRKVMYNTFVLLYLDYCSVVRKNCSKKLQKHLTIMVCESYYRYLQNTK